MAKNTTSRSGNSDTYFGKIPVSLLDSDLPHGAMVLFAVIDNMGISKNVAWPSITFLAKKLRVDRRTVTRWVKTLEEFGALDVQRSPGRANRYTTRCYGGTSDTTTPPPGVPMSPSDDTTTPRTRSRNKIKKQAAAAAANSASAKSGPLAGDIDAILKAASNA